jgi:hypothetical protein
LIALLLALLGGHESFKATTATSFSLVCVMLQHPSKPPRTTQSNHEGNTNAGNPETAPNQPIKWRRGNIMAVKAMEERTFFFGFLRLQATLLTSPEGEGAAAGTFF